MLNISESTTSSTTRQVQVWWPGVSAKTEELVKKCSTCMKLAPPIREPLISSKLPKHPWERIATDLFELNKQPYLLLVDYYSCY